MKKNVRLISVVLSVIIIMASVQFSCFAADKVQQPRIIDTVYPSTDVIVADIVLTEAPYNADNTGKYDCSATLQKAVDDLYEAGGGTVFLPAGKYRLCSGITIRPFVTVAGDWQDPDTGNDYGTVIIADVESTTDTYPALFNVGGSAGAVGLTVWYPNQSIDNVIPYPYTFYIDGKGANYMLQSIINCTLLNSYRGIGACAENGEGVDNAHEMATIENVKGTCLEEGMTFYNCADVDAVKTLYFSGKYWAEAGEEYNAPCIDNLNAYTKENLTAFTLGDLEWPEYCDLKADNCKYGIHFVEGPRASFSGTFYNIELTDCYYGVYAEQGSIMDDRGKQWGYSIANSTITADREAIHDYTDGVVMLTNVTVKGKIRGLNIHREAASTGQYTLEYSYDYVRPASYLYVVDADRTGMTDASAEVQNQLNAAAQTGGIVYLPAGVYRFDGPVTVPAGVELRGSGTVATRCQSGCSKGTIIISYYGYEDDGESALPLITVNGDNAGLYAIRVVYPGNSIKDDSGSYTPTSPAVKVKGDNCHVINCFVILSSCGFEFEGCSNAYIRRCVGCCIDSFIKINDCDGIQVEGCLQNGNAIPRNGYADFGIDDFDGWLQESDIFTNAFEPVFRVYTDFLSVNNSTGVVIFNTFIYGGRRFLKSYNSEILAVNVGSDGQSDEYNAYTISGGEVTVIGTMHSSGYGYTPLSTYEIFNGAKLKMYDRLCVDVKYNMFTRFENIKLNELEVSDYITLMIQPLLKCIEGFCRFNGC